MGLVWEDAEVHAVIIILLARVQSHYVQTKGHRDALPSSVRSLTSLFMCVAFLVTIIRRCLGAVSVNLITSFQSRVNAVKQALETTSSGNDGLR